MGQLATPSAESRGDFPPASSTGADDVLKAVAQALRAEVREYDHVGPFGGDEFVIALPGLGDADLYAVAERLHRRIHDLVIPLSHGHGRSTVTGITASVGGALYPHTTVPADHSHPGIDTATVDELLRAATDSVCNAAKRDGRDRVELSWVSSAELKDPHPEPDGP